MSNNEAEAYAVLAARDIGLSRAQAEQLAAAMQWNMDVKTESEAVRAAAKWLQSAEGG